MKNTLKIFLILLAVISTRCLDDSGVPAEDIVLDDTAKILRYIESTGDFANTDLAPALVSASELFNNRAQYFILDIRTPEEYSAGHIEFAVNISSANLYQVVDSLYTNFPFKKIVVVSK
ncbi:MAG TPA: rhodanese-like domain-containing protein, partial [Ignavibacteriaceae bacterium]